MKKPKIAVLGAGAWGTTIAHLLASKGYAVTLWGKERRLLVSIASLRQNKKYLDGYRLSNNLQVDPSLSNVTRNSGIVVFGIPTQFMRPVVRRASQFIVPGTMLVNLAKGIEHTTLCRASEVIQQETKARFPVAVLSGPNIAREIMDGKPSKSVVSATDVKYLPWLQDLFATQFLKVYSNPDLIGVELGGALKNVMAILAGVSDGLGYGNNTKSGLITRGLAEMTEFGVHFGANPNTFFGLSGLGDLIVTCSSPYSRNRVFGEFIAGRKTIPDALKMMHGRIPEGLETSRAINTLSKKMRIEMPLCGQVFRLLHNRRKSVEALFQEIWDRKAGSEFM